MKLLFTPRAWQEYQHWVETDTDVLRRLNELIRDAQRSSCKGIGKPEPLKGDLAGWWSRRITGDHRLVYRVLGKDADQRIEIALCRFRY